MDRDQDIWRNELLTVSEVAAYLRVGRVTVWRWCKQGLIPACQVGHHWRIHRDDLRRLIESPHSCALASGQAPETAQPLPGVAEAGPENPH